MGGSSLLVLLSSSAAAAAIRCSRRAVLVAVAALLLAGCSGLFFHPLRPLLRTPDELGLAYRDVWFEAEDGVRLHGWFLPAQGEALGTVLFLHGNAENVSTHIGSVAWLPARSINVFLVDYRGYGLSGGEPSLPGLHKDAEAALATSFTLDGVDPRRIALFGQSLGGSIAITALAESAYRHRVRALIVEGAFAGYRQIARDVLATSWLTWPLQWPLALAIDDTYRPLRAIAEIAPTPVLIIHGEDDRIVSTGHARDLYAAAREPKALWLVDGAGHIAALRRPELRERFVRYLQECAFAGPGPASTAPEVGSSEACSSGAASAAGAVASAR